MLTSSCSSLCSTAAIRACVTDLTYSRGLRLRLRRVWCGIIRSLHAVLLLLCRAHHPAGSNDVITLKSEDSGEMLTLMYEDPKADRVSGGIGARAWGA